MPSPADDIIDGKSDEGKLGRMIELYEKLNEEMGVLIKQAQNLHLTIMEAIDANKQEKIRKSINRSSHV